MKESCANISFFLQYQFNITNLGLKPDCPAVYFIEGTSAMGHNPGPKCGWLYFSSFVVINEVAFLRRLNPPLAQGTGTCAFKLLVRRLALDVDVGKWQISVVYLRNFFARDVFGKGTTT